MGKHVCDEEAAVLLSARVTEVVKHLMTAAGHNVTTLSKETGYSRVRISQVLNGHAGKNLWHLELLCAVARVFRVSVAELFRLASDEPGATLESIMERVSTEPGTLERLRVLIARMLSLYSLLYAKPEYEPDKEGDYERKFRCSPVEVKHGVPAFWEEFQSCVVSENDTLTQLWRAIEYAEKHGGLMEFPFWVALKSVFRKG